MPFGSFTPGQSATADVVFDVSPDANSGFDLTVLAT